MPNNSLYLTRSTLGHIMNDPDALLYEGKGRLPIDKYVLLQLNSTGWDKNSKELIESAKRQFLVLARDINKGPGWFYIENL